MSHKYEKKKTGKKRLSPLIWVLLAAVVLACVLLARLSPESAADPGTEAAESNETASATVEGKTSFALSNDLEITRLDAYTGAYVEDGSNDVVSGVLMIVVRNNGDQTLQYAEITLSGTGEDAHFKLSTLKPGEQAVVLEADRRTHGPTDAYTSAAASNVVFFSEPISLMEDTFTIQPLDGGFNITNISGEDITGRITVYFKNTADGMYYGGITYRGSIDGGMKAGEIRQIMSKNFSASGTEVVFVTITES